MSRLSDLVLGCLLPVTLGIAVVPVSSYTSNAQEHPGCWAYNPPKEFVNLTYVCQTPLDNTPTADNSLRIDSGELVNSEPSQSVSSTRQSQKRKCHYPWQLDSAGRRCGQRALNRKR